MFWGSSLDVLQPLQIADEILEQVQHLLVSQAVDWVWFLTAIDNVSHESFKVGQQVWQSFFEDISHNLAETVSIEEKMLLVFALFIGISEGIIVTMEIFRCAKD